MNDVKCLLKFYFSVLLAIDERFLEYIMNFFFSSRMHFLLWIGDMSREFLDFPYDHFVVQFCWLLDWRKFKRKEKWKSIGFSFDISSFAFKTLIVFDIREILFQTQLLNIERDKLINLTGQQEK